MSESTSTLVVAGVLIAGAVYLATRKATAPADDGPESSSGICGEAAQQGDKAGGYGLLAGPLCGIGEKIASAIGYNPDSKPLGFAVCVQQANVAKRLDAAEFCGRVTDGALSLARCIDSKSLSGKELLAVTLKCAAENKIAHLDGYEPRRTENVIIHG